MRSLRRNHGRPLCLQCRMKTRETVRAERTGGSGVEHGRPTAIERTDYQGGAPGHRGHQPEVEGRRADRDPGTPSGWEDGPGYGSLGASCRGPARGRWWRDLQEGYQNRDMKG